MEMTGPAAPKRSGAQPYFYILKDKDIFGERAKGRNRNPVYLWKDASKLINAKITGNAYDKEELTLLETVEDLSNRYIVSA